MTRDDKLNGLEHYERFLEAQRFESKEPAAPMTRDKTTNPEGKTAYDIMREMEGGPPKTTNPGAPMSDIAAELERLAEVATPGNLETAKRVRDDEGVECPACGGEGYLDARDYCNFDGVAVGVQFYGIGSEFGAHEDLWRAYRNHHATIIAALRAAATIGEDHELLTELDQTKAEVERMREALERLGSSAAFYLPRVMGPEDAELIMRMDFARRALAGSATPANQRDATDE